jgi:dienelactone hydrolase
MCVLSLRSDRACAAIRVLLIGMVCWPACAAGAATEQTEQAVSFPGADGATLAGTLQLPAGEAVGPGLVLVAGSGPTDRDGNQPPALMTDLLKQIAASLAERGIATLRYDKRGMYANKAGLPREISKFDDFFSWENFVGDVAAACRFLRQQRRVGPDRVGILGHSEGGMLALQAAAVLKAQGRPPAVLVLVSTPGRTIDAVIVDQLKGVLARQHATPQQTQYFLSENARITKAITQTGQVPPDVPAGLAALYPRYLGKFLHSELACDTCKLAGDFAGPVMVMQGSADIQVSPDRDAKALDTALLARKADDHTLAVIDNASHNLKLLQRADDPGFDGPAAPAAVNQLCKWAAAHLAGEVKSRAG